MRFIRMCDSLCPADDEAVKWWGSIKNGDMVDLHVKGKRRTLDQNAMIYALYQQIAEQKGDETIQEIRCECKAYCGVPILLAEDDAFSAMYRKSIMPHLNKLEKLKAMEILPVTSRMSKKQAMRYIDDVIRRYSQAGYSLVHPGEIHLSEVGK